VTSFIVILRFLSGAKEKLWCPFETFTKRPRSIQEEPAHGSSSKYKKCQNMCQKKRGGNEKVEGEFRAQNAFSAEIEDVAKCSDGYEMIYEDFHPYFF
jgi:hypothetical protein